jgi:hypothetical protein
MGVPAPCVCATASNQILIFQVKCMMDYIIKLVANSFFLEDRYSIHVSQVKQLLLVFKIYHMGSGSPQHQIIVLSKYGVITQNGTTELVSCDGIFGPIDNLQ